MAEKLNYISLQFDGKKWTENSISIVKDMCEVWDCDHKIIICHPNCVFKNKPVSREKKDFDEIEWQQLASVFEVNEDNSFTNYMPDANEAFKYIHKRFKAELFTNRAKNVQQPRHLVVVEQDKNGGCLVRGIFKATSKALMVAENPLYEKYKPVSIFDKHMRLTNDENGNLEAFVRENNTSNQGKKI